MKTVLFVCTSNVMRSVIGEYLFNDLAKSDSQFVAKSAGTHAYAGDTTTPRIIQLLANDGIDAENHRSTPLSHYLVENVDYIFAATQQHLDFIKSHYPEAKHVELFNTKADILNPAFQSVDLLENCYHSIKKSVENIYQRLQNGEL